MERPGESGMWHGTANSGGLAKSAGFRRNPQQHAGTGAIRQEKTPTENGWGFVIGGDGGEGRSFSKIKGLRIHVCYILYVSV